MSAALALVLALSSASQASFTPATPQSMGIDATGLATLAAVVERWVDEERIVGAEIAVVRAEHVVFHRGFGWRDRELRVPMGPGSVFCLRSMTKPVIGAAVQRLVDDGRLSASDTVASHLPAFDHERSRAITLEQLLTHTSGLPLSSLIGLDLDALGSERAVADLAGANGPRFEPGSRFDYSDDNADVLGALVEIATGGTLESFVREHVLARSGMHETTCVMTCDDPLRPRVCSAYSGGQGAWARHFGPTDPPLFPFLLGSQGLYGTALDYARFLRAWLDPACGANGRLLSTHAVRRALTPRHRSGASTGFADLECWYGEMMMLWIDPRAPHEERVVAFGHTGSDGTAAWAFPALDLVVVYLTQSRGAHSVVAFEGELQRAVLDPLLGREPSAILVRTDEALDEFVGAYWKADDQSYQVIERAGAALVLEVPGKVRLELDPAPERDHFRLRIAPESRVEFERGASGEVVALTRVKRSGRERLARLDVDEGSSRVDDWLRRKDEAVDRGSLAALGSLRIRSTFAMPALKLAGECVAVIAGERMRLECDYGSTSEELVLDVDRGSRRAPGGPVEQLRGNELLDARAEHPLLPVADWRALYADLRVIARAERAGRAVVLLRATTSPGHAHAWTIDAETALPLELATIEVVPGIGEVGCVTTYEDWRAVGTAKLPFVRTGRFANRLLGTYETRWSAVETGVELPADAFEPRSGE